MVSTYYFPALLQKLSSTNQGPVEWASYYISCGDWLQQRRALVVVKGCGGGGGGGRMQPVNVDMESGGSNWWVMHDGLTSQ